MDAKIQLGRRKIIKNWLIGHGISPKVFDFLRYFYELRFIPKKHYDSSVGVNKYGIYKLPVEHSKAAQKIMQGRVHEPKTIKMILSYSGDGEVIHAGAYFGDMLPGLRKCKRVWAFEPNFESYQCALKTIELNELTNIELLNVGLGAEKGNARMITEANGERLGGSSLINSAGEREIDVVTIDGIVGGSQVTVIHLDVEGYEVEALKGGMKTIERWLPVLILERNDCIFGKWFQDEIIDRLNYKWRGNIHGNAVFRV